MMNKKIYIYIVIIILITSFAVTYIGYQNHTGASHVEKSNKQKLDDIKETDPEKLEKKALQNFYKGNLIQSKSYYEKLTELGYKSNDITIKQNLAQIYKELGEYRKAIKAYTEILNSQTDSSELKYNNKIRFNLGKIYFQIAQHDLALKYLEEVYQDIDNSNFTPRRKALLCYYLGKTLAEQEKYNKSLKKHQKGITIYPELTLNHLGRAKTLDKMNNIEGAIKAYKTVLRKDNSYSYLYPVIAQKYDQLKDIERSFYYWKKSLATENNTKQAKQRINTIKEKYPELKEEDRQQKKEERRKINWIPVKKVPNDTEIPTIRVGLAENISKVSFKTNGGFKIIKNDKVILIGNSKTEYKIEKRDDEYRIYKDEQYIKAVSANSPLVIRKNNPGSIIVYDISYGKGYFWAGSEDRQYRGNIELLPRPNGQLNLINIVNITEYLFSVVPSEMPASWPKEALKAQTIAARSYAYKHMNKHQDDGYNVCSTVHCAAYKGLIGEHKRSTDAVMKTIGEVATYQGRIIDAVFSSNSGGYNESSKDVWGSNHPYLKGTNNMIEDNYSFPLSPMELDNWLKEEPASYSKNKMYTSGNSYRWVKVLSADYLIKKYDLDKLVNIVIKGRSNGGSVVQVKIIGKDKEKIINKDKIRSALGGLRSNRIMIEKLHNENGNIERLIIYGGGWGHNVGMDQTAAAGMAEKEFTYQEIIKHFYHDTKITNQY